MSRKGVLISDPSVERMTDAQWLFEAVALKKKEQQYSDQLGELVKIGRQMVISLLGLDLGKYADGDGADEHIVPLSLLLGDPDQLRAWIESAANESAGEAALNDENYEEWVSQLQAEANSQWTPDGDIQPLGETHAEMDREDYLKMAADMGLLELDD